MRPGGRIHHMIIGPGCSGGAITIAETAPFYHLTQVRVLMNRINPGEAPSCYIKYVKGERMEGKKESDVIVSERERERERERES